MYRAYNRYAITNTCGRTLAFEPYYVREIIYDENMYNYVHRRVRVTFNYYTGPRCCRSERLVKNNRSDRNKKNTMRQSSQAFVVLHRKRKLIKKNKNLRPTNGVRTTDLVFFFFVQFIRLHVHGTLFNGFDAAINIRRSIINCYMYYSRIYIFNPRYINRSGKTS